MDRSWYRRLCLFYKIRNRDTPQYLHDHLPAPREVTYRMRSSREFNTPAARASRLTNSFYSYCISEWEKFSDDVKLLPSLDQFKSKLILYIRPAGRLIYGIHGIDGVLTEMRVKFSALRSHRINHNFNCSSAMCSCNLREEKDNSHYFLCCPHFHHIRIDLLNLLMCCLSLSFPLIVSKFSWRYEQKALCYKIFSKSNFFN